MTAPRMLLLLVLTGTAVCVAPRAATQDAGPRADATAHDDVSEPEKRAAFVETIPGTSLTIEMVPVDLSSPVWVARTETTWDAYDAFVHELDVAAGLDALDDVARPSQPYMLADHGFGHEGYPVISVSHQGAEAFCAWLSARTGRRYRLPTESEWESLCCKATGCPDEADPRWAWTKENARRTTQPVGTLAADALGLYDLLGNVTEWCTAADGQPVAKGGSFRERARDVDCSSRKLPDPSWNQRDPQIPKSPWWLSDANFAGFRIVCEGDA